MNNEECARVFLGYWAGILGYSIAEMKASFATMCFEHMVAFPLLI